MRAAYLLLFPSVFLASCPAHAQGRSLVGEPLPNAIYAPTPPQSLRENRDPAYCYRMALKYDTGQGAEPDPKAAAKWYMKAADLGHPEAMTALGQLHQAGRGVDRDDGRAAAWYRRGAEAGSLLASFNLAVMLAGGSSLPRDLAQARSLYTRAAEHGFAKAQFNLGLLLAGDEEGQPDFGQAYKWLSLARDAGIAQADSQLAILAGRMTPEQVAQAGDLARQWRPRATH